MTHGRRKLLANLLDEWPVLGQPHSRSARLALAGTAKGADLESGVPRDASRPWILGRALVHAGVVGCVGSANPRLVDGKLGGEFGYLFADALFGFRVTDGGQDLCNPSGD